MGTILIGALLSTAVAQNPAPFSQNPGATAQDLRKTGYRGLNEFEDWMGFLNEASHAITQTNHDVDGDETYGINGFLEDADDRYRNYKTALGYHPEGHDDDGGFDHAQGGHGSSGGGGSGAPEPPANSDPAAAETHKVQDLPIYGEELFYRSRMKNQVSKDLGTDDANYVLRVGDTLRLHIWNGAEVSDRRLATVNLNGSIDLDSLGPIEVAGSTLSEVREKLTERIEKRFLNVNVTASVEERRTIQVVIAGNVTFPGVHQLPPGATLLSAMLACGGPSKIGTYRDIVLNRSATESYTADLYDLLNFGKRDWDKELVSGDTIWVRQRGPQIRVDGEVKKRAYYELKEATPVGALLDWAGLKGNSFTDRITISRYSHGRRQTVVTVEKSDWYNQKAASLEEGDRIHVEPISDIVTEIIYLKGNIERPGSYQWREGITLLDVIQQGGRLLDDTDYQRVDVIRKGHAIRYFQYSGQNQATAQEKELISKNLREALKGVPQHNIQLLPQDEIVIYNHRAIRPAPTAKVNGEVFKPGQFELHAGTRISDVLYAAGGLKPEANLAKATLTRRRYLDFEAELAYTTETYEIDLRKILEDPTSTENHPLENYDVLRVNSVAEYSVSVTIAGEIQAPGEYVLPKGSTIADLIDQAGGYRNTAYPRGARFYRERVRQQQEETKQNFLDEQRIQLETKLTESLSETEYKSKRYGLAVSTYRTMLKRLEETPSRGRLAINMDLPLSKFEKSQYNLPLESGDILDIPEMPREVSVVGFVYNNGSIVHQKGLSVKDYIKLSGGLKEGANAGHIYIFKANGSAIVDNSMKRALPISGKEIVNRIPIIGDNNFVKQRVEPGDVIFVPPTYDLKDEWDFARGVIDTAFKTAITAGVIASIP